jgi:prolyl oligopeptidase
MDGMYHIVEVKMRSLISSSRTLVVCLFLIVALAIVSAITAQENAAGGKVKYPATPKLPVADKYFDIQVSEDYRWLEDGKSPQVQAWVEAQNKLTRDYLDSYPSRKEVAGRLKDLFSAESSTYYSLTKQGNLLFAIKNQPPKQQPYLVALNSADDTTSERILVDPNRLDSSGGTAIDFYMPSHDARLVAVSLSQGGSEDGSVHIYDVTTGKELPDVVPHVNYPTAGGSVAWNADNTGFYYTRYPAARERRPEDAHFFQQVYFHELGSPVSSDQYAVGKDFPRIAEVALSSTEDGKYVLATVSNGDGGEYAHYLQGTSGAWSQVTQFSDKISQARFGLNGSIYLLSRKDAPNGKLLQMPLTATELSKTKTVVSQGSEAIYDFLPTSGRLYVVDMAGGPTHIRVYNLAGDSLGVIANESISASRSLTWMGGDDILFEQESYLHPAAWYHYGASSVTPSPTALKQKSRVNFEDAEVIREMVTSRDGSKVPINIIRRKGTKLDGQNPTILYGYGGYNISLTPGFSVSNRFWLDQGGVYAIANIRGGGEFGDAWHQAGNLTRKQNVFDDFAACAQYLIDAGYTSPAHLAIEGGSNGGLLMGAELVQHPDLFRVVVSYVGIYDMLRVELSPNGEFNTTEFGTVKDRAQFDALYAYSPYHHVVDGAVYPAVIFLTGENDGRVDPANSRKMTARLQAASGSDRPILLRQSSTSGHGIGTAFSEEIEQSADVYSFLFSQLGMGYKSTK